MFGVNLPPFDPSCWWTTPIGQTPHRCPVCEGRGKVSPGFYGEPVPAPRLPGTTVTFPEEPCRSCAGSGVLWR